MFSRNSIGIGLAMAAAASLGISAPLVGAPADSPPRRPKPRPSNGSSLFRRPKTFLKPFDPVINRHTGRPHEHRREIARNLKRAAKAA